MIVECIRLFVEESCCWQALLFQTASNDFISLLLYGFASRKNLWERTETVEFWVQVKRFHLLTTLVWPSSPLTDSIWAVCKLRQQIIRTVMWSILYCSCTHLRAHSYEQFLQVNWACWFTFRPRFFLSLSVFWVFILDSVQFTYVIANCYCIRNLSTLQVPTNNILVTYGAL